MSKGVILIDFDGTIVEHKFPLIGRPLPDAFEVMAELKSAGWKLILWTCREDDGYNINRQYLTDAVNFCRINGVEFDAVNETIQDEEFRPEKMQKRKPYCRYCIDDRNLGGFPGWDVVRKVILDEQPVSWRAETAEDA